MSQVNLLPPEVLQKLKTRRLTILIGVAGGVVAALLVFLWAIQGATVDKLELQIQAQTATNGELEGQINDLADAETLQAEVLESDTLVNSAMAGEISWWSQIRDVQLVIPDNVGLTSMGGSAAGPADPAALFAVTGNLSFSGVAGDPDGAERVARWLGRSNSIIGWANPWLSGMTEAGPYTGFYSFSSTVDLTTEALTARGQGATAPAEGATT